MGKIVNFRQFRHSSDDTEMDIEQWEGNPEGVKLYFQLFKYADGEIQKYVYRMIGWDLLKDWDSRCYMNTMNPEDGLSLIGYAAAKAIRNTTKDVATYYRKLAEFTEKYGLEVLKNVKTN